jgi:heat shock protein HtpX
MGILKVKMFLLVTVFFAIVYAVVTVVGVNMGISNFYFYLVLSFVFMLIQYMMGPFLVERFMRVSYVDKNQFPRLHEIVEDLARKAKIPKPRVAIAQIPVPNAFAFGRGLSDGRVCVTEGVLKLLNEEELRAVLGHELSHLKNRDVATITLLSVVPMLLYRLAWHLMFFGGNRRREQGTANAMLVGLVALAFYFITNLLVLYASRIREYFADRGSILLGNRPSALASALYKLVYGSARTDKEALKDVEGLKAFFINDPSRAANELRDLKELDRDNSGTIDLDELDMLRRKTVFLTPGDRMLEAFSTHPNMLKRIKALSEYKP